MNPVTFPVLVVIFFISLILNISLAMIIYNLNTRITEMQKALIQYSQTVDKLIEENRKSTVDNYVKAILEIMEKRQILKKE